MSAPTVSQVTGWQPGALAAAGDRLAATAAVLADDAADARRLLGDALAPAGGDWATTAEGRAEEEHRRGVALADAMASAAVLLHEGAAGLRWARERVVAAVELAQAAGFAVDDDGVVTSPLLLGPPELPPLDRMAAAVSEAHSERASVREELGVAHQAEVAAALAAAAVVDESVADDITGLDVPDTLPSLVAAHQARTHLLGGDHVAALGTAGGFVAAGMTVRDGAGLVSGVRRLHDYAALARAGAPAPAIERARVALTWGTASHPLLKVAGHAALPLTVASGIDDVVTGGGYEGPRDWATRGFGAAGAVGAGTVMAGAVLAPPVVVAGGVLVLAYGAWSAGNYAVDHWDQVEDAGAATDAWIDERELEGTLMVVDAVEWAGERLAEAPGALGVLGELF